jgi:hypothetical protein
LKRLVAGLAFLSSVAAFLVVVGGGLALLLIVNSGERGAGALLALSGSISFAAAMMLLFAGDGALARLGGRAGALIATLLAVLPPAALSLAAMRFAGFPFGGAAPFLWSALVAGVAFALGTLSVAAVGYERMSAGRRAPAVRREAPRRAPDPEVTLQSAAVSREDAFRQAAERRRLFIAENRRPADASEEAAPEDDEVRVTPVVDLPSIDQFRRR